MKKKFILLFLAVMAVVVFCACGGEEETPLAKASIVADETVNITLGERLYYLENVSAVGKAGENLSHLITVEMPEGVSIQDGFYVFDRAGDFLIEFSLVDDGVTYTAQTIIHVV